MTEESPARTPESGILDNLPSSRPQRRSAKRDAKRPPRVATADESASGKPRAGRAAAPKAAAKPRPKANPKPRAAASAGTTQPVRPRSAAPAPVEPPSNGELLASAAAAVGELAQLGLKLSEQLLRAATQRIPKP